MVTRHRLTKVLFVFLPLGGGGAERQFALLIEKLDRQRFDPFVVSIGTDEEDAEKYLEAHPEPSPPSADAAETQWAEISRYFTYRRLRGVVPIYGVRRSSRWSFLAPVAGLMRIVRRVMPDIIFCFYEITAFAALPAAVFAGAKLVQGVRGTGYSNDRTILSGSVRAALNGLLSRRTSFYIGNSQGVVEDLLSRGVPVEKCRVIFNGIEARTPLPSDLPTQEKRRPLHVGMFARFYPEKDHGILLRAIALLRGEMDVVCHLYGNGPLQSSLESLRAELGIVDNVVFEGWVPNAAEKMEGLDIVLLTSRSEGFNNSIAEAQLAGIPVVTTDAPGCGEIVVDGETGFVVPVGSAEAVATAIGRLARDPGLRSSFGAKARERARSHFSVERMVLGYERLFDELMEHRA